MSLLCELCTVTIEGDGTMSHGEGCRIAELEAEVERLQEGLPCAGCKQPLTRYLRSSPLCIRCSDMPVAEVEALRQQVADAEELEKARGRTMDWARVRQFLANRTTNPIPSREASEEG